MVDWIISGCLEDIVGSMRSWKMHDDIIGSLATLANARARSIKTTQRGRGQILLGIALSWLLIIRIVRVIRIVRRVRVAHWNFFSRHRALPLCKSLFPAPRGMWAVILLGVNWTLVAASDYARGPFPEVTVRKLRACTSPAGCVCTSVVSCLACGRIRLAFIVLGRSRKWTFHDRMFSTRLSVATDVTC